MAGGWVGGWVGGKMSVDWVGGWVTYPTTQLVFERV